MADAFGLIACAAALAAQPADRPADPRLQGRSEPAVAERQGAIIHYDQTGRECALTPADHFTQPALSPDGRLAAFVQVDKQGDPGFGDARSTLWLVDVNSGQRRRLLAPAQSDDMTKLLDAVWQPEFSLNGGYVYVMAEAWTTSSAIHQVNVATGGHRFVTDGELLFVIRSGRYAGYLMVQKHKYHPAPEYGSYNPVFVVRPDAKWAMMVPGSDKDEGEHSVEAWMKRNRGR